MKSGINFLKYYLSFYVLLMDYIFWSLPNSKFFDSLKRYHFTFFFTNLQNKYSLYLFSHWLTHDTCVVKISQYYQVCVITLRHTFVGFSASKTLRSSWMNESNFFQQIKPIYILLTTLQFYTHTIYYTRLILFNIYVLSYFQISFSICKYILHKVYFRLIQKKI